MSQAEVHDADTDLFAGAVQHNIGGFDIAVKDSGIVDGSQGCRHLLDDRSGFGQVDSSLSAYSGGQSFAGQELHRQEVELAFSQLDVKDVVDRTKIRMDDFAGEQDLPLEAPLHRRLACDLWEHRLQSETNTLQVEVLDFVDLPHSTFCNKANDKESVSQDIAWGDSNCWCGCYGFINLFEALCFVTLKRSRPQFFLETRRWMLKKASSLLIPDKEGVYRTPELLIAAARSIEIGTPLCRIHCEGGIEQLLD